MKRMFNLAARIFQVVLLLAPLLFFAPAALAQQDFFLTIDNVQGGSTDASFKNAIVATGFSLALTNGSASLAGGKTQFGALVVTKLVDIASPILALGAASGRTYNQAVLYARSPVRGEQKVFYTITLSEVRVEGISQAAAPLGSYGSTLTPSLETVSLIYGKIQWTVGSVKAGWDLTQNKTFDLPLENNPSPGKGDLEAKSGDKRPAVASPRRELASKP
jgi:type VI secretion system Hcp family effector